MFNNIIEEVISFVDVPTHHPTIDTSKPTSYEACRDSFHLILKVHELFQNKYSKFGGEAKMNYINLVDSRLTRDMFFVYGKVDDELVPSYNLNILWIIAEWHAFRWCLARNNKLRFI